MKMGPNEVLTPRFRLHIKNTLTPGSSSWLLKKELIQASASQLQLPSSHPWFLILTVTFSHIKIRIWGQWFGGKNRLHSSLKINSSLNSACSFIRFKTSKFSPSWQNFFLLYTTMTQLPLTKKVLSIAVFVGVHPVVLTVAQKGK